MTPGKTSVPPLTRWLLKLIMKQNFFSFIRKLSAGNMLSALVFVLSHSSRFSGKFLPPILGIGLFIILFTQHHFLNKKVLQKKIEQKKWCWVYNYISPFFERLFINDAYSCRVGKGTSYGIKRVNHFIRSCSQNYSQDCYILKLDIKGYFMGIDRSLLYQKDSILE